MNETGRPGHLLLIDDDALSREVLLMLVEAEGYTAEAVGCGEDGVARIGRAAEDGERIAVLTDLQMPGLSGAALAEALRQVAGGGMDALLAMSGSEPAGGPPKGYDGFLLKPFSMGDLAAALATARGAEPKWRAREGAPHTDAGAEVLDVEVLARLQSGMTAQQLEELFLFALTDAEQRTEAMREAVRTGDAALYRRSAHTMKGSFGMLGAPEMQSLAAEAESNGLPQGAEQGTLLAQFLHAQARLRHTLVSRGVCR